MQSLAKCGRARKERARSRRHGKVRPCAIMNVVAVALEEAYRRVLGTKRRVDRSVRASDERRVIRSLVRAAKVVAGLADVERPFMG